jgi:hypothetical protein
MGSKSIAFVAQISVARENYDNRFRISDNDQLSNTYKHRIVPACDIDLLWTLNIRFKSSIVAFDLLHSFPRDQILNLFIYWL